MNNNRLILIGNGSSVIYKELGNDIDSFDIVIRFNNFKITGYEKNVGTKVDYWFTWSLFNVGALNNLSRIYFHSWVKDKNIDKNYIKVKEAFPNCDTIIVNHDILDEIKTYVPNYPHKAFSTGLIATHIMLKSYQQVYLYGFDWWLDGLKHHYSDNADRGKLHHPKLEYEYFKIMEQNNRVIFL